jgi:hypothetical protein
MFIEIPADYDWIFPWVPLDHPSSQTLYGAIVDRYSVANIPESLVAELNDEMCSTHKLQGAEFRAIAFCQIDFNEVLYLVNRPETPIVNVHLTWQKEKDRNWPYFWAFESLEAWTEQMKREAIPIPDGWQV